MEPIIRKEAIHEQLEIIYCPVRRIRKDVIQRLKPAVTRMPEGNGKPALICPVERVSASEDWLMPVGYRPCTAADLVNGYRTIIAAPSVNWITDFLWEERWAPGEFVFVDATCSAGKNYYIESLVTERRYEKILVLANRRANKEQILKRLGSKVKGKFRNVEVYTYQSLETNPKMTVEKLEAYDLIVLDECHYFTKDSEFSSRVNVSFSKIMATKIPIKMFMSATMTDVRSMVISYLRKRHAAQDLPQFCTNYVLKRQKQNIREVNCIDDIELLVKIKKSKQKWLVFVDSKDFGNELKKKIGADAVFINADNVSNGKEEEREFWNLVEQERFDHRVLISTAVLDNGVNIKDKELSNIVIGINDRTQMVQMLGRKRCVSKDDVFNLYLLYETARNIGNRLNSNQQEQVHWKSLDTSLQKYGWPPLSFSLNSDEGDRLREIIWMDNFRKRFHFNQLGFLGLQIIENDLRELLNSPDIFTKKVDWLFGGLPAPPIGTGTAEVQDQKIQRVIAAVERHIGQTYPVKSIEYREFQKEFSIAFWASFGIDTDENQRADRILSTSKINLACEKFEIPIRIVKA